MKRREQKQDPAEREDKAQRPEKPQPTGQGVRQNGMGRHSGTSISHLSCPTAGWSGGALMSPSLFATHQAQLLGDGCPGKGVTSKLRLTWKLLTAGVSADHTPCSWTATESGCLISLSTTEYIHTQQEGVRQSVSHVCCRVQKGSICARHLTALH